MWKNNNNSIFSHFFPYPAKIKNKNIYRFPKNKHFTLIIKILKRQNTYILAPLKFI